MSAHIGVVIPSYKVKSHILEVIARIGPEVDRIYVIDDACPEHSGQFVARHCSDPRVRVLHHLENHGVGGAVLTGYQAALDDNMDIIVKIDGDGQMDPRQIHLFVDPILANQADYTKGNRFYSLETLRKMPKIRLIGNAALSLMTKLSSGYWELFDPTNGYTAIHSHIARLLPMEKISQRFLFETDLLFRLNTLRAVVLDIPMHARYANEISNLKIIDAIPDFLKKNVQNFCKRIFYSYYLHNMSIASIDLPIGLSLVFFGLIDGLYHWIVSIESGTPASSGTVMIAAIPILVGIQLLHAFLGHDIQQTPQIAMHQRLAQRARKTIKSPTTMVKELC